MLAIPFIILHFLTFNLMASELCWMTDGSPITFTDTQKISGVFTPFFPLKTEYEGGFDHKVPIGEQAYIIKQNYYPSAEAEWVIIAENGFTEDIDDSTEVVLQGMIEGKYFGKFYKNQKEWFPASLNNNLIADGPGIRTTLGEIRKGKTKGTLTVKYVDKNKTIQTFIARAKSLKKLPLIPFIRSIVKKSYQPLYYINLGAVGKESAFVNDPFLKGMGFLQSLFGGAILGGIEKFKRKILYWVSQNIIKEKKYTYNPVLMSVTDQNNQIVGTGKMNFFIVP